MLEAATWALREQQDPGAQRRSADYGRDYETDQELIVSRLLYHDLPKTLCRDEENAANEIMASLG